MPQVTTMSRAKLMIRAFFAVAIVALLAGCTTSNSQTPQFDTAKAAHPAGWVDNHWAEFAKNPDRCVTCHGSWKDPAAAGGISNTSCFTCHPKGPGHPAGWEVGLKHGRIGAMAAPGATSGMAYCFKCHGNNLNVGLTETSCLACHTKAPHPAKPWSGADPSKSVHYATDVLNAPECIKCHANGANSTVKPATPAPAGTAPGCFNNTMCHSKSI
jgi:hypothetical protein